MAQDFRTAAAGGIMAPKEVQRIKESAKDKPSRTRRFREEVNQDAVRLVVQEGYNVKAAAVAVGVSELTLPSIPCPKLILGRK